MTEAPQRNLALELVRVTEAAALAAGLWVGRGAKEAGDGAAVEAMRLILATTEMDGVVVIGEGEKDEAPMLYHGEKIGNGRGPKVDVAVDPVEGTNLLARGAPDAISVVGVAPRDTMWKPGPAFYMNKLVVARAVAAAIKPEHLNAPVKEVLKLIGDAKEKKLAELTVFVLDKPRHAQLIDDLRKAGVRVLLRTDGDVAGALMAARPGSGVDALMGIGGTPEGVIAACAVRALGGAMLGQLAPQRPDEIENVKNARMDTEQVLTQSDLVQSDDVFFAATGITDGVLLQGVHYGPDGPTTASLVMRGKTGTVRTVIAEHSAAKLRALSSVAY